LKPSIVLITAAFGAVVAAAVFCLGYMFLELEARTALAVGLVLGAAQAIGGGWYIWRRLTAAGRPPRDGGRPG
jgi:nitrate reductase gamma subunit